MKRILYVCMLLFCATAGLTSCYDDDDLWSAVDDLQGRVESIEKTVKEANADIDALKLLVDALNSKVTIVSVTENEQGYSIVFSDGKTATITNGNTPQIAVRKDSDGVYYWTLNGEWLLADGKKIKAEGADGAAGKDAVAPKLRINPETKEWEMSVDGGGSWQSMGVKADGTSGTGIFQSVDTTSKLGWVIFTLANGEVMEIPTQSALSISLSADSAPFVYGETLTFTVKMKGVERFTYTKPDGWKVAVEGEQLSITAPDKANAYAEAAGTVVLIGMSGHYSCMAEIRVSVADKHVHLITFEGEEWSKAVMCNYAPGKFSTTNFQSDKSYTWTDATTQLTTGRPEGFMGGWGYPWFVSSYNSKSLDQSKYGGFNYDLYVYNPDGEVDSTKGGGRNHSDNFITTFGYLDLVFPYGDGRPILEFADKKPRTIKSLYVNSTCYFYSVAIGGNELSPALSEDILYYATGVDAEGKDTKTITMVFGSTKGIIKEWTKWDLSELGPIVSLRLNQAGGADNGYGYSLPAYYAIDDITVEW